MKRLISANASELLSMNAQELKQSIKASEGRVVCSENIVFIEPYIYGITNSEIASAFGADLILLNGLDVLNPEIKGIGEYEGSIVKRLQDLVGKPIGVNLEPVDMDVEMAENRHEISNGRQANLETIKEIERLGFNFVCFTGNPGTGVSNEGIANAIKLAKEHFSGLIIAGKMHGAGANEPVVTQKHIKQYVDNGADIILVPAVGTVPGFDQEQLKEAVKYAHQQDALVLSAIGTSQESSDPETIRDIALMNKICGVDIQHIGDAGYHGMSNVENIYTLSKAIRGIRHTISSMARSIRR